MKKVENIKKEEQVKLEEIVMEEQINEQTVEVKEAKEGFGSKVKGFALKNKKAILAAAVGIGVGVLLANQKEKQDSDEEVLELYFDEEEETFKYDEGYTNGDGEA